MDAAPQRRSVWTGLAVLLLPWVALAAAPAEDVKVTGQVVYGSDEGARRAAEVDIVRVYNTNPAYIRMKSLGLSDSSARGRNLFDEAESSAKRALAVVAARHRLDVITVPGGVEGGEIAVRSLTDEVIDELPLFCVEGTVLHGRVAGAQRIGELDSQSLLEAIPAYVEWLPLNENDARYHILRKRYQDDFARAVRRVARSQDLDAVVEKGDVTARRGPVPDVTRVAIETLGS